jgi:hypothetical protein
MKKMPGWTLLFALLAAGSAIAGTVIDLGTGSGVNPEIMACMFFGLLLAASFVARALRDLD